MDDYFVKKKVIFIANNSKRKLLWTKSHKILLTVRTCNFLTPYIVRFPSEGENFILTPTARHSRSVWSFRTNIFSRDRFYEKRENLISRQTGKLGYVLSDSVSFRIAACHWSPRLDQMRRAGFSLILRRLQSQSYTDTRSYMCMHERTHTQASERARRADAKLVNDRRFTREINVYPK